jgi:hypothetical protein
MNIDGEIDDILKVSIVDLKLICKNDWTNSTPFLKCGHIRIDVINYSYCSIACVSLKLYSSYNMYLVKQIREA